MTSSTSVKDTTKKTVLYSTSNLRLTLHVLVLCNLVPLLKPRGYLYIKTFKGSTVVITF